MKINQDLFYNVKAGSNEYARKQNLILFGERLVGYTIKFHKKILAANEKQDLT